MGMLLRRHNIQLGKIEERVEKPSPFVVDNKVIGKVDNDVIEITDSQTIKENQFTKTDINRMPLAELKELAKANSIDGADDMSGSDIKKALISIFGL